MAESATNAQLTPLDPTAPQGSRFVWHDLMTTDLPASLAFYTALFGWERRAWDMEGGTYDMIYVGEVGLGGMVPLAAKDGIPSHWIAYISVADVDAACARADATGGKTHVPPTDIPTVGRFAVVEDPTGAVFSPFVSTSAAPPQPANAPRGTIAWNELMTTDPERAGAFYGGLTGWTVDRMDMGPAGFYHLFMQGGAPIGGMMQMPAGESARSHWLPYVDVADCDAYAARAAELGARTYVPPTDIEDWGRFAVFGDPTGAVFGILQNKRPM